MVNPRRSSYVSSGQSSENPFQTQSFSLSSILNLLKKPQAFPFLLSIFILLTWVSLKFQHSSHFSPLYQNPKKWSKDEDLKANLVRFLPSKLAKKDKRGWLLNPVAAALDAGISGGAVSCASVHVGEIRPGGIRGNHRHYTCNETFIIWGARIKFRSSRGTHYHWSPSLVLCICMHKNNDRRKKIRNGISQSAKSGEKYWQRISEESLSADRTSSPAYRVECHGHMMLKQLENSQVVDKGYAEVEIGADEVAVASSPSGTAHALVNVDPIRTAFLLGCQDNIVNYNSSSSTAFNIWNDL